MKIKAGALSLLVLVLAVILEGCGGKDNDNKPRFFVVLLDETGSFQSFDKAKEAIANKVIPELGCEETFCLIGIDNHGFDTDDVRIPVTKLSHNFLEASQQKRTLGNSVNELKRRDNLPPGTDIIGALQHAAQFLNGGGDDGNDDDGFQPVILVFSDLVPDNLWPETSRVGEELGLSSDTMVYFFFVEERGKEEWEAVRDLWADIFVSAGIVEDEVKNRNEFYEHFFLPGQSESELENVMRQ